MQLPAQLAAALDEQRLVDRLVAHPHHRIVWELDPQAPAISSGDHHSSSHSVTWLGQRRMDSLEVFGPPGPLDRPPMGPPAPVAFPAAVGGHLPGHRRDRPADLAPRWP